MKWFASLSAELSALTRLVTTRSRQKLSNDSRLKNKQSVAGFS